MTRETDSTGAMAAAWFGTPGAGKAIEAVFGRPQTYVDDAGEEKRERRRKDRANDDPRIDRLFNGFDNMIASADEYSAGYMKAMRLEFGQLISSLVR